MKVALITMLSSIPLLSSSLLADSLKIIPEPSDITFSDVKSAKFSITSATVIVAPDSLKNESSALVQALAPATGFTLKVQSESTTAPQIKLLLTKKLQDLGKEGYSLQVTPKGVIIKAADEAGIFYGIQSLIQLLPPEIVSDSVQSVEWSVPALKMSDTPRFAWRAFMLDEARYFKGEKEVKKLLDQMAALKMNVFHWHLTDDQGWRIEIKKYPKLTTVGSKRTDTQTGTWGSPTRSGEPHSGFYTQEEIKDIVAYAKARHITIVPEIGMPGHAVAAIAAYPELGTNKKPIEVMTVFGKAFDTYDPSSDFTYEFMSDVIDEVIELFPSKMIHIGGDEVRFDHWKNSESVKALMQREKLETMADVQLYFTNRMAGIIQAKGRNVMGWNEILGDDLHGFLKDGQTAKAASLDKDTVVHFWQGSPQLAKKAIKNGHTVVNSWAPFTYLDYSYASIPLEKAYSFNPIIEGLTPEEEERIIGLGCQMWSEWIPTVANMERQVYPRLAAYSEVGWTEKENKDFAQFKKRMNYQLKRWDIQGIQYAQGETVKLSASDFFNHTEVDTWKPELLGQPNNEITFATGGSIKAAAEYEVAFLYSKGAHALSINSVSLLENGKVISTDEHHGMSGHNLSNMVYKVKVPKFDPAASYTLKVTATGSGGNDSHGSVKIRAVE